MNTKYWSLYFADEVLAKTVTKESEIPAFKILTAAGIIEANLCPDPYDVSENFRNLYYEVACQIDHEGAKNHNPQIPVDGKKPLMLRNVTINGTTYLKYMMIFPEDIIGISV